MGGTIINTNLSAKLSIMNFEVHIIRNNELLYAKEFKSMSREIYAEYTKQFEHLKKGDVVEFTNIQYKYPSFILPFFVFDTYDVKVVIE